MQVNRHESAACRVARKVDKLLNMQAISATDFSTLVVLARTAKGELTTAEQERIMEQLESEAARDVARVLLGRKSVNRAKQTQINTTLGQVRRFAGVS